MNFQLRGAFVAAVVGVAGAANAAVLYSTGFETVQGFTVGALPGQQGWLDDSLEDNYTVVANGQTGQGVAIDTAPMSGADWAFVPLNYAVQAGDVIKSRVSVAHLGFGPGATGTTTSRFGLDIYNGSVASIARVTLRFAAGSTTQAELQWRTDTNTVTTVNINAGANQWQTIGIDLDTDANLATFFLNGNVIASAAYTTVDTVIADADLFASPIAWDTGGFDNYSVEVTPVPEPGTLAALGLGAAALLRKRRR